MPHGDFIEDVGRSLARARAAGQLIEGKVRFGFSDSIADAVQTAACQFTDDQQCGYSTTRLPRNDPSVANDLIVGPLFRDALIDAHGPFRLPRGVLGAQPAILFKMGRLYPQQEEISRETIESAIITCELGLAIVGQRFPGSIPLTAATATADFGLHVAHIRGPAMPEWLTRTASTEHVSFFIDETRMKETSLGALFDRALSDLADLAIHLTCRGGYLNTGDLAVVGSRLPAFQVQPGRVLRVEAQNFDPISVRLE